MRNGIPGGERELGRLLQQQAVVGHTPGPWTAYHAGDERDVYVGGPNDTNVCENATEADARLIAAAPEMLEALRIFDGYKAGDILTNPVLRRIREAIAKATSEAE